ncbi:MAG: DMT family transporter [Thermoanaerobacterales bacterium]|nr:DMT family transporter [Thermoanaerobacterales bacterium]
MSEKIKGYVLVASAAIMWGLSGAVAKVFFNQNVDLLILQEVRFTLSAFFLFICIYFSQPKLLFISRNDIKDIAIYGLLGIGGLSYCCLYAVKVLDVATGSFLQYLSPAFIAIYAFLWKKEKIRFLDFILIALSILGAGLLASRSIQEQVNIPWDGILAGIGSAIALSYYSLKSRKILKHYNLWVVLAYSFLISAIPLYFIKYPWVVFQQHYSWQVWVYFLYMSLFANIIPYGLFTMGLRYINAYHANIVATLEPVAAAVFGYILVSEKLTLLQMLGCFLILTAVIILQKSSHKATSESK